MKKHDTGMIVLFFSVILLFSIGSLLKEDVDLSQQENRVLAKRPEVSVENFMSGEFSNDYETYLSEQFLCRNSYIRLHTAAERLLGKREVNGVCYGAKGYLFELQERSEDRIQENIGYLNQFIEAYGRELEDSVSILLVPDKAEVLPEYVPAWFPLAGDPDRISHIYEQCKGAEGIWLMDIYEAHKDCQLFYRTDHHWTGDGSYYAYCQWRTQKRKEYKPLEGMKQEILTDEFFGALESKTNLAWKADSIWQYEPVEEENTPEYRVNYDGKRETASYLERAKLETKDGYGVFFGGNYGKVEINTNVNNGKRLLIIKDSFANALVPYLLDEYEKITMTDLRYYNQPIQALLESSAITEVLIVYSMSEFSKGSLYKLAPYSSSMP